MAEIDLLVTIGTGAAGGVIALVGEQIYLHFKEKWKESRLELKEKEKREQAKIVQFPNEERVINESIFNSLTPGSSVELMKAVLGTPNKIYKDADPLFTKSVFEVGFPNSEEDVIEHVETPGSDEPEEQEKEIVPTNVFLYRFENADVKVTSKDKETVDSLTVLFYDENVSFAGLMFPWAEDDEPGNAKFGITKVTESMAKECRPARMRTMRDNSFALSLYTGAPLYNFYTYFGIAQYNENEDWDNIKSTDFIGSTIYGVCISNSDTEAYYIWSGELL